MNYKRICKILGIIIILSLLVLAIKTTKADMEHKKNIETKLGFSEEQKKAINYKYLVEDIKSVEKGVQLRHAKEKKDGNSGDTLVIVEKEYLGDGYIVKTVPAYESFIFDFYIEGNCVYTVVINSGWGVDGCEGTLNILVSKLINYAVFGIMIIVELVFYILYKKSLKKEKEDKK